MAESTSESARDDAKERAAALLYFTQVHLLKRDPARYFYQHAMKEADFSDADSKDPTIQRRIRRLVAKMIKQEEEGDGEMRVQKSSWLNWLKKRMFPVKCCQVDAL